jgi:hypothetical protein
MKKKIILSVLSIILLSCNFVMRPIREAVRDPIETALALPSSPETIPATPENFPTQNADDPVIIDQAIALEDYLSPSIKERIAQGDADDQAIMDMLVNGMIFPISGLYIDRVGALGFSVDAPDDAPAYVYTDTTGTVYLVGWYDRDQNMVIEVATEYPLNVRSAPGAGIIYGSNGEEFYVYGFAWYPRWGRIFPEPVIDLLEDFYSEGVAHVRDNLSGYQSVASNNDSNAAINLVAWNDDLLLRMNNWGQEIRFLPFMHLPDSGTVDIRAERFQEAINTGRVIVDEDSITFYLQSDAVKNSVYNIDPTREEVRDVLLTPYRRPEAYSGMQKAIILSATFDGDEPVTIKVNDSVSGGVVVYDFAPSTLNYAPSEVDVYFGYEGVMLGKYLHEMSHLIENRDTPFYMEGCLDNEADVKESLKYLEEYMWWVQQYPGDAPWWDWETINSGIILAHLLVRDFPNSHC